MEPRGCNRWQPFASRVGAEAATTRRAATRGASVAARLPEEVGAPDLKSAVSVSAGWSVFAMRDGAVYNTYRVYLHSRLVTPLFSWLLELLPNPEPSQAS